MPLGMLAKDSMVNLVELASKLEEEAQGVRQREADETTNIQLEAEGDSKHDDGDGSNNGKGQVVQLHVSVSTSSNSTSEVDDDHKERDENDDDLSPASKTMPGDDKASVASSLESLDSQKAAAREAAANAPTGQYAGFSADYHDFEHYANHSYAYDDQPDPVAPINLGLTYRGGDKSWWCCLFPWVAGDKMELMDDPLSSREETLTQHLKIGGDDTLESTKTPSRASSVDEDERSTSSDMFGEKLSDKDRQAVLARLRLAPPDEKTSPASDLPSTPTQVPSATPKDTSKQSRPRSILRRSSTFVSSQDSLNKAGLATKAGVSASTRQRRSLFPAYERKMREKKDLHTTFSPMARVVTIKSIKDMSEEEKADIWWQKHNYEEFRKTGRMITRAMLEGGSEIWLATNRSWQMPNQGKAATLQNASSLADQHAAFQKGDRNAKIQYEDTRDKWWHKFGHSRRGLEHIASIDEGRQRQANVKSSIKTVLDEQRRQKAFHREDPEKLRMVSIQNTAWARDLALASGASDADAVTKNFDDESRKSREFYLLKFSRANMLTQGTNSTTTGSEKVMPAFMEPMMSMQIPANRLDAHTTSQIRYRQKQHQRTASGGGSALSTRPTSAHHRTLSAPSAVSGSSDAQSDLASEAPHRIPIRDDSSTVSGDSDVPSSAKSLAKMAAGYADGVEEGDMSAVLSGMGHLPKTKAATTVGGA